MKEPKRVSKADEIVEALDAYVEKRAREFVVERDRLVEEGQNQFRAELVHGRDTSELPGLKARPASDSHTTLLLSCWRVLRVYLGLSVKTINRVINIARQYSLSSRRTIQNVILDWKRKRP